MRHLASLLLCAATCWVASLSVHAEDSPAASVATAKASPVGTWKWFVGRDVTFRVDGTVTYPGNFAVWRWTDESKRRLRVEWKSFPSTEDLILSDDGKQLRSEQPIRGLGPSGIVADRIVTPLGTWSMNKGADVSFREDHSAAFSGVTSGFWYWTDEPGRQFKVEWTTIPYVDNLTLSEDGQRVQGSNHIADDVSGVRIDDTPPPNVAAGEGPATQPSASSAPTAGEITPVGVWRWFYGPNLTFQADGIVSGTNRDARWSWTDQSKRQLRIDFGGRWSAYHDSLTLSEDGNHLEGKNNADMHITGDRITAGTAAIPADAAKLVGAWYWSTTGYYVTFHPDHTLVSTGELTGRWNWTDEKEGKLQIDWSDNHKDLLMLSSSGKLLSGTNEAGATVNGHRVPREPGEAPDAVATGPVPPVATTPVSPIIATPVGTWSWFVGPDLTFHADGTLTGKNRVARWKWTDEAARQLEITWDGVQSGLTDKLILSADGKHLEGSNGDGITVTGDKMEPPAGTTK